MSDEQKLKQRVLELEKAIDETRQILTSSFTPMTRCVKANIRLLKAQQGIENLPLSLKKIAH